MNVHVDFYDRNTHFEMIGQSTDKNYKLKGTHEKNRKGAIAHAKEAIANHNRQTPNDPDYIFATHTFH